MNEYVTIGKYRVYHTNGYDWVCDVWDWYEWDGYIWMHSHTTLTEPTGGY